MNFSSARLLTSSPGQISTAFTHRVKRPMMPLPDSFKKARCSEILVGGNDGGIPENGGGCNESISRVIIDLCSKIDRELSYLKHPSYRQWERSHHVWQQFWTAS